MLYLTNLKQRLYFWLPIIFGCHCKSERSFHYKNKQFPLCARCTGELIGILGGIVVNIFVKANLLTIIILMLPMLIDGFLQLKTSYTSNNFKRLLTGILFGYSLISLFILTTIAAFLYGYHLFK